MAIEIKQTAKLAQQAIITPQLQQAIKLLQLSRMELTALIQKELVENPLLEEVPEEEEAEGKEESHAVEVERAKEENIEKEADRKIEEIGERDTNLQKEPMGFEWENYLGIYNEAGLHMTEKPPEDLPTYETTLSQPVTFQDHLLWQLHLSEFADDEKEIAVEIIGNINDDGYLVATVEEIASRLEVPLGKVEEVLKKVQRFDPPGVGARDLKECLILQINQLNAPPEEANKIIKVIEDHMEDLERSNYTNIAKKLKISVDEARHIAHVIRNLEPKPGRQYSSAEPEYIVPDVYVYKLGDEYVVVLNEDGMPKLRISDFYRQRLLASNDTAPEAKEYIVNKMHQAAWLIRSIHQRQRTLYKVAASIVKFQREFLDHGISHLKPLVLKDVAEDVGVHESTVSRVTANKYMHTPRGIFEFKFFFSAGLKKEEGDWVASETVRFAIRDIINSEDPRHPLNDEKIAEKLKERGFKIARRTVTKYRESLNIPPSSKRKRFE